MIKAWLKGRKIKVVFEHFISDIEMNFYKDDDHLTKSIARSFEQKVTEEVMKYVESNLDKAILDRIAKELLENYDFKPLMEEAMRNQIRAYLRGSVVHNASNCIVKYYDPQP